MTLELAGRRYMRSSNVCVTFRLLEAEPLAASCCHPCVDVGPTATIDLISAYFLVGRPGIEPGTP